MRFHGYLLALSTFVSAQDSISFDYGTYKEADDNGSSYQTFVSNRGVKPPEMQINSNSSGMADGYIFNGVNEAPSSGQNWPTIFGINSMTVSSNISPLTWYRND